MYPIRKIRYDYQVINEWLFRLFEDKIIEGTDPEDPFLVAILWILRIPKFIESWRNTRGNGHFNKGIRGHPTKCINSGKCSTKNHILQIFNYRLRLLDGRIL